MMEQLKPCPFCGGEAEIENNVWYKDVDGEIKWDIKSCYVKCRNPSCLMICETVSASKDKAIEIWNRRVQDAKA